MYVYIVVCPSFSIRTLTSNSNIYIDPILDGSASDKSLTSSRFDKISWGNSQYEVELELLMLVVDVLKLSELWVNSALMTSPAVQPMTRVSGESRHSLPSADHAQSLYLFLWSWLCKLETRLQHQVFYHLQHLSTETYALIVRKQAHICECQIMFRSLSWILDCCLLYSINSLLVFE